MGIQFKAPCLYNEGWHIIHVPLDASKQMPSRGMVMVQGTINDIPFKAPLEPDGNGSHWLIVSEQLIQAACIQSDVNEHVTLTIEPIQEWDEPNMPKDIMDAILQADLLSHWQSLTTKAHWEWLRWIRATHNPETRKKRIQVACSKLSHGDKRPCCFNASACSIPELAKLIRR